MWSITTAAASYGAAPGRDSKTVLAFFDVLRKERCKALELISADMAAWISGPIAERAPQAERCVDLGRDRVREIGTDRRRTFRR